MQANHFNLLIVNVIYIYYVNLISIDSYKV